MNRYRVDIIAGLARQLGFAPLAVRRVQIDAAETFVADVDDNRAYTWAEVIERITGRQPQTPSDELIPGEALRHDLSVLVEEVSGSLELIAADQCEPVLTIDDVTTRFNVTSKTIQRWRKRGLISRRFVFADGRSRVGFMLSSVERFIATNGEAVERGANFSHVDDVERESILRHAERLAVKCRCCVREITRRVGRRFNRSPLTVLHTVRKFDEQHPDRAIFVRAAAEFTPAQSQRVAKLSRRGVALRVISERVRSQRSTVYRAVMDERVSRIAERKVNFHDDPLFHEPAAEQVLQAMVKAGEQQVGSAETVRPARGIPPYLADLYRTPLLTPALERSLFLQFNFYKFRFVMLRRQFDPELARNRELEAMESALRSARQVKNRILQANLRLAVSVARKHMGPGQVYRGLSLMELVSEGNLALMRAVEAFDPNRNVKFSTYATLALMKGFARVDPKMMPIRTQDNEHINAHSDDRADRATDLAVDREQIAKLLSVLDERERRLISMQFGLDGAGGIALDRAGQLMGLRRGDARALSLQAMTKLRDAAAV
jgi:RNA polymerase sigma factor (sigma-70 family)